MLQLLQPIWLYAIAGIAIPIIIHLWDVRGGKRLKVGSILLIEESARLQGRSLKLTDILLLILRCLLIIILAIVLSKPVFKKQLTVVGEKGWLMISRQDLQQAYKVYQPAIDSLINVGYQFHYFDKGFIADDLAKALQSTDSKGLDTNLNHWALLRQLNEQVPPDLPVHVFANNKLKHFQGERPTVSMDLTWHGFALQDTSKKSTALAYATSTDSIRILTANSSNTSLFYEGRNVSARGDAKYKVSHNSLITNESSVSAELEVDTSVLVITIFTDQYFTDANYLRAAVEGAAEFTQRRVSVTVTNNAAPVNHGDWLFWLSEKPLPSNLHSPHVFRYATGKMQPINSWLRAKNNIALGNELITLSRRIAVTEHEKHLETIWKDGFGDPILTVGKQNQNLYHFYSRFNPAWTGLPWSADFAQMIFNLIIPSLDVQDKYDNRIIETEQAQPLFAKSKRRFDKERFIQTSDLRKFFWLLAFLLFATERFISLKNKNIHA